MFELRVLSGLHQGAALPLIGEHWAIGSDAEQDLALHDPGVAMAHCQLRREGDRWVLKGAQGEIRDQEGHRHEATELAPDMTFVLGSVWLCLSAAEDPWPTLPAVIPPPVAEASQAEQDAQPQAEPAASSPPLEKVESRSRLLNRTTGIVIGVLLGIAGSAWSLTRSSAPVALTAGPVTAPSAQVAEPAHKRIRLASIDDTRRQLNTMLSDRLLGEVNVQQTAQGLKLSGNLNGEAQQVYQRMLRRFKDRYETPVPLIDEVTASSNGLPFTIVQIMSGPHAHLVTADGHRLYIGDELNGLRLTRIDDNRIAFDGDRHYEVNW